MGTKTCAEIMQALDHLLLDETPTFSPWSLEHKHRAINRAIRSAWPNFKVAREDASAIVLATATYQYSLADIGDIGDIGNGVGICQVLLELGSQYQDWVPLQTVTQSEDDTMWYLHVPEGIVDANVGRKLKLRYYAPLREFTTEEFSLGSGALASEFANYVLYSAAVDLIGLHVQSASEDGAESMLELIPTYSERARAELRAHTVGCMPVLVKVRSKG